MMNISSGVAEMATMSLDKQQSIYILTLHNGDHENALNKVVLEE